MANELLKWAAMTSSMKMFMAGISPSSLRMQMRAKKVCRLHSHGINYPAGSTQQQVTCYDGENDDDYWIVKPARTGEVGAVGGRGSGLLEPFVISLCSYL